MKAKTPLNPVRWYAQDEKTHKRLIGLGIPKLKIYDGWKKTEHWSRITMRNGEVLGILGGLRAFGGLRDIPKAVDRFHGQAQPSSILNQAGQQTHGVSMRNDVTKPQRQSAEYEKLLREERADARRKKDGKMLKREAYIVLAQPEAFDCRKGCTLPAGRPVHLTRPSAQAVRQQAAVQNHQPIKRSRA